MKILVEMVVQLCELAKNERNDESKPPRAFSDYTVPPIDPKDVPQGVDLIDML